MNTLPLRKFTCRTIRSLGSAAKIILCFTGTTLRLVGTAIEKLGKYGDVPK